VDDFFFMISFLFWPLLIIVMIMAWRRRRRRLDDELQQTLGELGGALRDLRHRVGWSSCSSTASRAWPRRSPGCANGPGTH